MKGEVKLNLHEDVATIIKWYEEIIDISDGQKFILYTYDFVKEYFKNVNLESKNIDIEYEPHEVTVSILYNKFIARLEGHEVKFYKRESISKEFECLGYYSIYTFSKSHFVLGREVRKFHPDYIVVMMEEAFVKLNETKERIINKENWLL